MRLQVTSFYNGLPDGLIYYELIEYFQTSIVWPVNMILKRTSGERFDPKNNLVVSKEKVSCWKVHFMLFSELRVY